MAESSTSSHTYRFVEFVDVSDTSARAAGKGYSTVVSLWRAKRLTTCNGFDQLVYWYVAWPSLHCRVVMNYQQTDY